MARCEGGGRREGVCQPRVAVSFYGGLWYLTPYSEYGWLVGIDPLPPFSFVWSDDRGCVGLVNKMVQKDFPWSRGY